MRRRLGCIIDKRARALAHTSLARGELEEVLEGLCSSIEDKVG